MKQIAQHSESIERASEEAVKLWAFASAQYPFQNRLMQEHVNTVMIEAISSFALNAHRAMEGLPPKVKYPLNAARWLWSPKGGEKAADLWDALNRIVHARKLYAGFERLPERGSVIDGGAIIVPYIRAETDRKEFALIDPFALSHAFLYGALPALIEAKTA